MTLNKLGRLGVCDAPPLISAAHTPSEGHPMAQPKRFCDVTEDDLRQVYDAMPTIHGNMTFQQALDDQTMRLLMQRQAAVGMHVVPDSEPVQLRAIPAKPHGRLYLFEDDVGRFYHAMRDALVVLSSQGKHASECNALEHALQCMARYTKPAKSRH